VWPESCWKNYQNGAKSTKMALKSTKMVLKSTKMALKSTKMALKRTKMALKPPKNLVCSHRLLFRIFNLSKNTEDYDK
jgi:hypothetical protein